jgi:hypothetical protein
LNAIDAMPADWLCSLLRRQEDVRSAEFDLPPNRNRILLTTTNGQRLAVSIGNEEEVWDFDD